MMPLFGKSHGKSVNYKARLEHKLYLARENPDPVFDLADCDLKAVPSGVYSLCKVFRKESLLLQNNHVTSLSGGGSLEDLHLLQVLDVRSNNLSSLADSIRHLTSLKELYLNNNYLKCLPECISELKNLRILSCSFNKLKRLPQSIGEMKYLEQVHLQGNPALCVLPDSLCLAQSVTDLVLDVGRYTHPPDSVVLQGTVAVMKFLSLHMGIEYGGPRTPFKEGTSHCGLSKEKDISVSLRDKETQEKMVNYLKKKEERVQERLSVEKDIELQKKKEYLLHSAMKTSKTKFVEDLKRHESKIAEEVQKFQTQKDAERVKLIKRLQLVEESADQFINQMLAANSALKEPTRVLLQEELDRVALQKLFSEQSNELRRREVLSAMESLLAEERMQRVKLQEYELAKAEVVKNSLSKESEWSEEVDALLSCRSAHQSALVASIAADERDQVVAVATLLERNDLESVRLRAQLQMIEKQLATLTSLELHNNFLNLSQLQCDLSEKRAALSMLLVDILNQQQERKKHLLQTLVRMEHNRWEDSDNACDYWLKQYQKLLDLMPKGFSPALDSRLVHQLVVFGVIHCLPFLGQFSEVENITDQDLISIGVNKEEDRAGILKAISAYHNEMMLGVEEVEPNAPEDDDLPTAPPAPSSECVVCLNSTCEVVFVPCGHLCCCKNCCERLTDCPLCRSKLERKIRVISV